MTFGRKDDIDTAKLGDRLIAAAIGGPCGYFFGLLVAVLVARLFHVTFGLQWFVSAAFAVYAFLAPSRSTELWSGFWEGFLSLMSRSTR